MTKNPILQPLLCVSAEPSTAIDLFDFLRKRRGGLIEVRRFACTGDPDLAAFHGRFVFTCKRVVGLEAIAIGAAELGGGVWLAHSVAEVAIAGVETPPFTREEIARIAGDRQ